MPEVSYPIEMVNGVPVVAAPAGINISNAGWLQAVLLEAAARGHATFVVDMTCTQFCASAGVGALVQAHKHALAEFGELPLVIPGARPGRGRAPKRLTPTGRRQTDLGPTANRTGR